MFIVFEILGLYILKILVGIPEWRWRACDPETFRYLMIHISDRVKEKSSKYFERYGWTDKQRLYFNVYRRWVRNVKEFKELLSTKNSTAIRITHLLNDNSTVGGNLDSEYLSYIKQYESLKGFVHCKHKPLSPGVLREVVCHQLCHRNDSITHLMVWNDVFADSASRPPVPMKIKCFPIVMRWYNKCSVLCLCGLRKEFL